MIKNYAKELIAIAAVFGFISYTVYVVAAPVPTAPAAKAALENQNKKSAPKEVTKPAGKEVKKPLTTKEIVVTPDPKKDPNRKKPTLKKKYADKK